MNIQQEVRISNISDELNRIWEAIESKGHTRACLFTLLIFTVHPQRASYFQLLIQKILEKFPCRILFIHAKLDAPKELLETHVSIETIGAHHGISCDQIRILSSKENLNRIPFIVLPQIIPDLPVYLIWSSPNTIPLFRELEKLSTRLIFDSDNVKSIPEFATSVTSTLNQLNSETIDLNWGRLDRWREVIRHAFNTKEHLQHLKLPHSIKITYNATSDPTSLHPEIPAIYLQAWFAAQFGWSKGKETSTSNVITIQYQSDTSTPVQVTLEPCYEELIPSGTIKKIEVFSGPLHYEMHLLEGSRRVRFQYSSEEACSLPHYFLLSNLSREQSLVQAILYNSTGDHYPNMLKSISQTQWNS